MYQSEARKKHSENCKASNDEIIDLVGGRRNIIVEYHKRGANRTKVGVIAAYRHPNGDVMLGYSLCNTKCEQFCPHIALNKALSNVYPLKELATPQRVVEDGEAKTKLMKVAYTNHWDAIPRSLVEHVEYMVQRAYSYFKSEEAIPERNIAPEEDLTGAIHEMPVRPNIIHHVGKTVEGYELAESKGI